jgi:hypothetical protein
MRLIRTLSPAAALLVSAVVYAQTAPPAGPTSGGTAPPSKAPGAGGTTPAPKAPGAGGTVPGPKVEFPTQTARTGAANTTAIFPTSFVQTPEVARTLSLNERQVAQLNAATDQVRARFQPQFDQLATLPERERADRTLQLNREFTAAWLGAADDFLTADQVARYRQLQLQFDGFRAFADPAVQRQLALTEAQLGRLPDTVGWSNLEMQAIMRQAELDRARGLQLYSDYVRAYQERLNQFLTAEQMRSWREMTGDPFQFPPPFPPTTGPGAGAPGPTTGGTAPPGGPTTGGTTPPKR